MYVFACLRHAFRFITCPWYISLHSKLKYRIICGDILSSCSSLASMACSIFFLVYLNPECVCVCVSLCLCRVIADWAFYALVVRAAMHCLVVLLSPLMPLSLLLYQTFWSLYVVCFSMVDVCVCVCLFSAISSLIKKYFSLIRSFFATNLSSNNSLFLNGFDSRSTSPHSYTWTFVPFLRLQNHFIVIVALCMSLLLLLLILLFVFLLSWVVPFFGWIYEHENHRWLHELGARQLILAIFIYAYDRIPSLNSVNIHIFVYTLGAYTLSKNYEHNSTQIKFVLQNSKQWAKCDEDMNVSKFLVLKEKQNRER